MIQSATGLASTRTIARWTRNRSPTGSTISWRSRVVEVAEGHSHEEPHDGSNTSASLGLGSSSATKAGGSNGTSGATDEQGSDDDDDDDDDADAADSRPAVMHCYLCRRGMFCMDGSRLYPDLATSGDQAMPLDTYTYTPLECMTYKRLVDEVSRGIWA